MFNMRIIAITIRKVVYETYIKRLYKVIETVTVTNTAIVTTTQFLSSRNFLVEKSCKKRVQCDSGCGSTQGDVEPGGR